MKAVHLSIVALIGAVSGIGVAIATKNSEALVTSDPGSGHGFPAGGPARLAVVHHGPGSGRNARVRGNSQKRMISGES